MRRARRAAIAYIVAGILALCGLGFLIGAGFTFLAQHVGTIAAALWFAGGFFLVALIVLLTQKLGSRAHARETATRRSSDVRAVASAAAIAMVPTLLAGRGKSALLVVPTLAALGYAVWRENSGHGRQPPPPPQ